jgi:hypothetical protein
MAVSTELFKLDDVLSLPTPAFPWKWRVTAVQYPSGISIPHRYYHAVPLTFQSIEAVPFHRQATTHNIPGFESLGSISVTMYETETYEVTKQIQKWRRLIKNDQGLYTIPFPTADMELTCYDNSNMPAMRARLYAIWPNSQSPSELSYDNSNRLTVNVEFSVNRVRIFEG